MQKFDLTKSTHLGYLIESIIIDYNRINQLIDHGILASIIYLIDQIPILIDFLIDY